MKTEKELIRKTQDFFKRYWNPTNGKQPEWERHWYFDGTIPKGDKRGCYALFKDNELIYIGVGIGKSFGQYHGSGLGDRLKRYWQLNKSENPNDKYEPTNDWGKKGLTSIRTIGFEEDHYPIAAALEVFLIKELDPPENKAHRQ